MYLLYLDDNSDLKLHEHVGYPTPPYAILSHTWGNIDDEISYKDVKKGRGKDKAGYTKVTFCLKQAAADNLKYCWVDTCCIDKSSSAELSEAINSMFRWYKQAVKCYVYMADVSTSAHDSSESRSQLPEFEQSMADVSISDKGLSDLPFWMPQFEKSRWFTRGWTLQELLAPSSVDFFSVEGERLGDKNSLKEPICRITKIAATALEGKRLALFEPAEIFQWTERRNTTREEDEAYSLLGIFDVSMPILYGEGRRRAMSRLHRVVEESMDEQHPLLDILGKGQQLMKGEIMTSRNEAYRLTFQTDGNLVLSGPKGILWQSNTGDRPDAHSLTMQDHGNLILGAGNGEKIWASETLVPTRPRFQILNDGNAVIGVNKDPVWQTHTAGGRIPDVLEQDHRIRPNQPLMSRNGKYTFVLEGDGNLVLRGPKGVLWTSGHNGRGNIGYYMLQGDGNVVIFERSGRPTWAIMRFGKKPHLVVQDDGNLVCYSRGIAYWASGTRQ